MWPSPRLCAFLQISRADDIKPVHTKLGFSAASHALIPINQWVHKINTQVVIHVMTWRYQFAFLSSLESECSPLPSLQFMTFSLFSIKTTHPVRCLQVPKKDFPSSPSIRNFQLTAKKWMQTIVFSVVDEISFHEGGSVATMQPMTVIPLWRGSEAPLF